MAGLLGGLVSAAVSGAVKAAATKKSSGKSSSSSSKNGTETKKTAVSAGSGISSGYDKAILSETDRTAVERWSAAAKSASAAGDQAAVKAAHDAAETIRARYGYSGGQLGDEYIPIRQEGTVPDRMDTSAIRDLLERQNRAAEAQQENRIQQATEEGVAELEQAQQSVRQQFQVLRDQAEIDGHRAMDNQALYAEVRGDRGGIGQAQYGEVESAAARNRLEVNRQQVQTAAETARQIQQLRTQGEYKKADALLSLSQSYLSQLASLEKWAAEYGLSAAKFQAELEHWQQNYLLQVGQLTGSYNGSVTLAAQKQQAEQEQAQKKNLASAGSALLKAGILPSAAQLEAMGLTQAQARAQLAAQQSAAAKKKRTSSGAASGGKQGSTASGGKEQDYEGLFAAARDSVDARSFIANNYKRFGFTASGGLWDAYQNWTVSQRSNQLTILDREPEEGQFLWNGKRYDTLQPLLRDIHATELTKAEKEVLQRRFAQWGIEVIL